MRRRNHLRRRLLRRALSYAPDAVIANGDHIYWDQRTWLEVEHPGLRALASALYERIGRLDRQETAHSPDNEWALIAAAQPQIGDLYGVMLCSTPGFYLNDDHDYFENDEATQAFVTCTRWANWGSRRPIPSAGRRASGVSGIPMWPWMIRWKPMRPWRMHTEGQRLRLTTDQPKFM